MALLGVEVLSDVLLVVVLVKVGVVLLGRWRCWRSSWWWCCSRWCCCWLELQLEVLAVQVVEVLLLVLQGFVEVLALQLLVVEVLVAEVVASEVFFAALLVVVLFEVLLLVVVLLLELLLELLVVEVLAVQVVEVLLLVLQVGVAGVREVWVEVWVVE